MKLSDLNDTLATLVAQFDKAHDEIIAKQDELNAKISDLETALANVEVPADASAAIDALKTAAQSLDDIVPDPTPAPAPAQ